MGKVARFLFVVLGFVGFYLLLGITCGDPEDLAMYVCNHKDISIQVYGFYVCKEQSDTIRINRIAVHLIESGECIYFTDRAWECQLSWWDFWLEDVGCKEFKIVYFITENKKYSIDMGEINNARKVAMDSFVLTKDSIIDMLPDCSMDIY